MFQSIARVPRPFVATGLAAGSLLATMSVCTTSVMAASFHPAAVVILSQLT